MSDTEFWIVAYTMIISIVLATLGVQLKAEVELCILEEKLLAKKVVNVKT